MGGIFEGLYGNEPAKRRFSSAIRSGTLAHAFLIDGPRGSGKHTLSLEIAAALNCENKKSNLHSLPCRVCNTCRRIFSGSYTDIKELDRDGGKLSIGVDAIKGFKDDMFLSATESEYKVYIIKNAHLLTPQAQNALLTVMEEPPFGVVIMLLSESSDKILTTIKSRAQYTSMQIFSQSELSEYLAENLPEAARLKSGDPLRLGAVIMRSGGCIGQALELLEPKSAEEAEKERRKIKRFAEALDVKTAYSELYSSLTDFSSERGVLASMLEEALAAVSDMIKAKATGGAAPTEFFENGNEAIEFSSALSQKRLFRVSELISEAHGYLTKNASAGAVISSLAAKIKLI